jgi:LuxR family maltose regulon positive regulatory protein
MGGWTPLEEAWAHTKAPAESMSIPLLETKLYAPRTTGRLVPRPRLATRLQADAMPRLLLVSAPAGFGKSTMLAQLLDGRPATAWLSLDQGDNEPVTFWSYVVAALRSAVPGVGETASALLHAPAPPMTTVLTSLVNELAAADPLVLVLDDYHLIETVEIHESMGFLLDHLPAQAHLVIAGRADPPLPLARLRARGELVEVRAADLRFTDGEATAYFEGMGLHLDARDVAALEGRTEGWIAALQLAALSLRGRDDVAAFIEGFAGDDRYVVDYLVEEVVQRQPEDVRRFLLETSILDRLSGPLCDAVTGQPGGRARLEALDRANLFLVALDDRRQWYRYHHLFADVLRARLLDEHPEQVPDLHGRASAWHEEAGNTTVAIEHALAAGDSDRAAGLVESVIPALTKQRRESQLRRWMEALPEEAFTSRPVLANGYVGALMSTGEVRGVEPRLRIAEGWVEAARAAPAGTLPAGLLVALPDQFRKLPGWIKIHRAGLALMVGEASTTVHRAREAIALLDGDDDLGHGAATALMGLASWRQGDVAAAETAYAETIRRFERVGYVADVLGCAVTMAELQLTLGRLRAAERTFRDGLDLVARETTGPVRGTPDMHVGLSMVHDERGDLAAAREHLRIAHELGDHLGLPKHPHRWRIAEARIREADGDLAGALALLDEAERVYDGDFSPDVQPVAARRARVWVRQGRADLALDWAQRRGLSPDDDVSYLQEYEHVTLARALLAEPARGRSPATTYLGRLLADAEAGGRTGSVLEVLVLQSLAHQRDGDHEGALASLARALSLGEPEGYVRTFVDEGAPMQTLLRAASKRGIEGSYAERLLRAAGSAPARGVTTGGPVEPLSDREGDVLRLLASELTGPEIARQLVVSLNTVRTHTKNIYAKLGVTSRRAAVRRAGELGLLSRRP